MNRRKKSLTYLLLLPLLLVVLLQGIVPFSILLASGTRETMERNTVDIDSNLVEKTRVLCCKTPWWTSGAAFGTKATF